MAVMISRQFNQTIGMEHGKHKLSKNKAREILSHGEVQGHTLTKKQRGLFGAIASGSSRKYKSHGSPYVIGISSGVKHTVR